MWDLRPANVRNNANNPANAPVATVANSTDELESAGSDEDVPIAENIDHLVVNDDGDAKNIRRVDRTFLLG